MNSDRGLLHPDDGGDLLHVLLNPHKGGLLQPDHWSHPPPLLKPHHVGSWSLRGSHLNDRSRDLLDRGTPVDQWGLVGCDNWSWVAVVDQLDHLGLRLDGLDLLLEIIIQVKSHHVGSGCLRCIHLRPDGRLRDNLVRSQNRRCRHCESCRHQHPWSLVHQTTSLLVKHLYIT